ncbi:hypothetical protein [uncultured Victivallis sp.]|uniref:hypothetical protein n=1 Tax=uncultured Victivallis sp. TaxID=354118 RepID=UPI0025F2795F|nr:hypothetical protein [uncultured Victivallis sp.]
MITLEQAFYGRDPEKGYQLLGSSDPRHDAVVTRLCDAAGTPDGSPVVEPFYIHHIENGFRYMISGCAGTPDGEGRMTLFFHAFIGGQFELERAGFGIGVLIQEKAFRTKYEPGPVFSATFEESCYTLPWGETSWNWNHEKLAVRSRKPELPLLTGLLKNAIDSTSWASFSFRPIDELQLYVISEFVPLPRDRNCVSTSGELIREMTPRTQEPVSLSEGAPHAVRSPKWKTVLPILLAGSLLLNCLLLCVLLFQKSDKALSSHSEEVKESNTPAGTTRAEVLRELRDEFERQGYERLKSSEEFEKKMMNNNALKEQYEYATEKEKGKWKGKEIILQAENYIRFVHEFIFEENVEKEK